MQNNRVEQRLERLLAMLAEAGPTPASEACARLGCSQSTFSRLVGRAGVGILKLGRGRATRYARPRQVVGIGDRLPIYRVPADDGPVEQVADLLLVAPGGFYLEANGPGLESGIFSDLPWFLDDMRPAGFLGRLVPRRHPELGLPADVLHWTADHALRYLVRFGWDLPGDLIVGEGAFQLFIANARTPPNVVERDARPATYEGLADDVLAAGPVGSSAAGEQPKFLAYRGGERQPVLVKFSPPVRGEISERLADLLISEHLALEVLADHGRAAARSELVFGRGRVFLEVERFDRTGARARRGTISLTAVDAEFVGRLGPWSDSVRRLVALGLASRADLERTRWLELFGGLIANTDMHSGNLSFFCQGTRLLGLTPAYDVAPMAYAPRHEQLVAHVLDPPMPTAADGPAWEQARQAAVDLWHRIAAHERVSSNFKKIAGGNAKIVEGLADVASLLPGS